MSIESQSDAAPFEPIEHVSPELRSLVYQKDYDLVLLTEVCPKNSRTRLEDSHINMPSYQVVSYLSCTRCKQGVLAMIKNTYAVHELSIEENTASVECVWFDLTDKDQRQCSLRAGCIYQSLSSPSDIETEYSLLSLSLFHSLMFCQAIQNFKGNFIVGHDFSFPELIWKDRYLYYSTANSPIKARPFLDIVNDLSAYQLIEQPTWFPPPKQSMVLDLVFGNRGNSEGKLSPTSQEKQPSCHRNNHL